MKIVNVVLLTLLSPFLLLVMWEWPPTQDGIVAVGIMLIPVTYLTACYWKGKKATLQRILMFGAFYNGGCAAFLIYHVVMMHVAEQSHPVAFAILEELFSMLVSLWATVNSLMLWLRRREITQVHDA